MRAPVLRFVLCGGGLLAGLLGAAGASAQMAFVSPTPDYFDWSYHTAFDVGYQTAAQIAAPDGGRFDVLEIAGAAGLGGPLSNHVRLTLDAAYSNARYDFETGTQLGCFGMPGCAPGSPWQTVNTLDVWAGLALVINDSIHLIANVPVRWSGETDSDESGVTAGVVAAVRVRIAERFTTILGIGVQNELAEDTGVYPVIGLDWRILDSLRLVTRGGPYEGGDITLIWSSTDTFHLYAALGYDRRRFQLSRNSVAPSGVAEYRSVPVLAGVKIDFAQASYLALEGGVATGGSLRIDDRNGGPQGRADFGAAGLMRVMVKLRF